MHFKRLQSKYMGIQFPVIQSPINSEHAVSQATETDLQLWKPLDHSSNSSNHNESNGAEGMYGEKWFNNVRWNFYVENNCF